MPGFAWQLELEGRRIGWRQGDRLFRPEPGTNIVQRALFTMLGWLPLEHFF